MASLKNNAEFRIEDNILKGKEVAYSNDYGGLGKFVLDNFEKDLDFVGQIDAITDAKYTYGEMRERSIRCALWMRSQGVRPGDTVTIFSGDQMDFAMPCFASLYLGSVFHFLDVISGAEDILHEIRITKPKIIFVSEDLAVMAAEAAQQAKLDLRIIVFGRVSGFVEFNTVIAEPKIDEIIEFRCTTIGSLGEIAAIIFSSGSTGFPKAIALSHKAIMMLTSQSEALGMFGNVCLIFAPSSSIVAIENFFMTVLQKMPRMIVPECKEDLACALIEKHKVNRNADDQPYQFLTLNAQTIIHSGILLSSTAYKAMLKLQPQVRLFSGYGLTETCAYVSLQSAKSQPQSCGEIMANTQLKVIDPETGRILGANQRGEILIKSSFMMSCYWGDPQGTAQIIDEEGWLHSGDLGYYDESGEIFVIDRVRNVIRTEYYDICPSEIESVILTNPGVKEVAVVGKPRDLDEDILIAFVVKAKGFSEKSEQVLETEIVNLVAAELPESRHIRAGVRFIDRLPRTATGKIQRLFLRNLAKSNSFSTTS